MLNGGGGGNGEVRRIREAPHVDVRAERHFLGGCLLKPELISQSGVVRADFFSDQLATVWDAITSLYEAGHDVNEYSVIEWLSDHDRLRYVGGDSSIHDLAQTIPAGDHFSRRIRTLSRKRAVAAAAQRIAEAAADPASDESAVPARRLLLDEALRELDIIEGRRAAIDVRATREIFAPLPPVTFVVPGLHLGPGRPLMWAGYGASLKTLSIQSLGLAIASGTPIWNHFEVTAPGIVLHLDYEQGFRATARRYQRLAAGHGIDPARLGDRLRVVPFPRISLDQPDAEDVYARACEGATVVIVDAFKGATPTKDENDSSIRTCLDTLSRVSDRIGCSFIVLHHAGKPKPREFGGSTDKRTGPRGSSGIFDACGAVFDVQAGKTPADPRRVEQTKMPADAEGTLLEPFALRVEDVELAGNPTGGVRVVWAPIESEPSRAEKAEETYDADLQHMLELVHRKAGQNQDAIVLKCGIGKPRAIALLAQLEEQGRVFVTRKGKAKLYRPADGKPPADGEGGPA